MASFITTFVGHKGGFTAELTEQKSIVQARTGPEVGHRRGVPAVRPGVRAEPKAEPRPRARA